MISFFIIFYDKYQDFKARIMKLVALLNVVLILVLNLLNTNIKEQKSNKKINNVFEKIHLS